MTSQKIGAVRYSLQENSGGSRTYTIYAEKNGKKAALIKDSISGFVTNGKYIYYTTGTYQRPGATGGGYYKNMSVKRYTISSKKSTVIYKIKGTAEVRMPFACDGTYLYTGCPYRAAYRDVTVYNLKNKKTVSIKWMAGELQSVNGKLLVSAVNFRMGGIPGSLYLMNRDGTNAKMIAGGVSSVEVKNQYIYFTQEGYQSGSFKKRSCRCDLNGKNLEVLSGWR